MAIEAPKAAFYADPAGLTALKRGAAAQTPEAIRETAKQFESLFTTMMLKSMRDASPGDSMFGSDQQDFYQDMFDQQLAVQLSKGKGLGLADVLVQQLMKSGGVLPGVSDTQQGVPAAGAGGAAATSPAAPGATASSWPPRTQEEFVQAVLPAARSAAQKLGVDPEVVVAHAALETGWGKSVPMGADGKPSFNLFGIKAGARWSGDAALSATHEFAGGRMQSTQAAFRAYDSPEHSIQDYAGVLQSSPRYSAALNTGSDVAAFARGLQQGGYATDPDYVSKLTAVAARLKSRFGWPISEA
jgi:peptidoglycan hydrolase FlgJ